MYSIFKNNKLSLRNGGFIIPVVAISLMVAMGIGVVHYTILNHQQKQSNLIERELTSFYIAESGYQWMFSKLKFEKSPFYLTSPNGKQDFFYSEKNSQGFFEYFIAVKEDESQGLTDLNVLIKGVFENKNGKQRDTTLLTSSMSYTKSNGEVKVVVKEKSAINIKKLFVYAEDEKFSKYFKNAGLLSKLKEKKVLLLSGSLVSPELNGLWGDLISLIKVNQKIDREIKFVQRIKNSKPESDFTKTIASFSGEDQAKALSSVMLQQKSFQLVDSSQEIDSQIKSANQKEIEASLKDNFIQSFKNNYAEHQTVILSPSRKGFLKLNQQKEIPISEFIKLMDALVKLMPDDSFNGFLNKLDQHLSTVTEPSSQKEGRQVRVPLKAIANSLSGDTIEDLKDQSRGPSEQISEDRKFVSANLDFPPPIESEPDLEPLEDPVAEDVPDDEEVEEVEEIVIVPVATPTKKSPALMCIEIEGEPLDDGSCNQHGYILQPRETWAEHCTREGGLFTLTVDGVAECEEGTGEKDDSPLDPPDNVDNAQGVDENITPKPEPEAWAGPIRSDDDKPNDNAWGYQGSDVVSPDQTPISFSDSYTRVITPGKLTLDTDSLVINTEEVPKTDLDIEKPIDPEVSTVRPQGEHIELDDSLGNAATQATHQDLSADAASNAGTYVGGLYSENNTEAGGEPEIVPKTEYNPSMITGIGSRAEYIPSFTIIESGIYELDGAPYDGLTTVGPITTTSAEINPETLHNFGIYQ